MEEIIENRQQSTFLELVNLSHTAFTSPLGTNSHRWSTFMPNTPRIKRALAASCDTTTPAKNISRAPPEKCLRATRPATAQQPGKQGQSVLCGDSPSRDSASPPQYYPRYAANDERQPNRSYGKTIRHQSYLCISFLPFIEFRTHTISPGYVTAKIHVPNEGVYIYIFFSPPHRLFDPPKISPS